MYIPLSLLSLQQKNLTSSEHNLLNAICIRANQENEYSYSIAALCMDTSLDRKTVIATLEKLCLKKLIRNTGKMTGKTRSIIVYEITIN